MQHNGFRRSDGRDNAGVDPLAFERSQKPGCVTYDDVTVPVETLPRTEREFSFKIQWSVFMMTKRRGQDLPYRRIIQKPIHQSRVDRHTCNIYGEMVHFRSNRTKLNPLYWREESVDVIIHPSHETLPRMYLGNYRREKAGLPIGSCPLKNPSRTVIKSKSSNYNVRPTITAFAVNLHSRSTNLYIRNPALDHLHSALCSLLEHVFIEVYSA